MRSVQGRVQKASGATTVKANFRGACLARPQHQGFSTSSPGCGRTRWRAQAGRGTGRGAVEQPCADRRRVKRRSNRHLARTPSGSRRYPSTVGPCPSATAGAVSRLAVPGLSIPRSRARCLPARRPAFSWRRSRTPPRRVASAAPMKRLACCRAHPLLATGRGWRPGAPSARHQAGLHRLPRTVADLENASFTGDAESRRVASRRLPRPAGSAAPGRTWRSALGRRSTPEQRLGSWRTNSVGCAPASRYEAEFVAEAHPHDRRGESACWSIPMVLVSSVGAVVQAGGTARALGLVRPSSASPILHGVGIRGGAVFRLLLVRCRRRPLVRLGGAAWVGCGSGLFGATRWRSPVRTAGRHLPLSPRGGRAMPSPALVVSGCGSRCYVCPEVILAWRWAGGVQTP